MTKSERIVSRLPLWNSETKEELVQWNNKAWIWNEIGSKADEPEINSTWELVTYL